MEKTLLTFLIALTFLVNTHAAQTIGMIPAPMDPGGFRGVRWGSASKDIGNLQSLKEIPYGNGRWDVKDAAGLYVKENESLVVEGARAQVIIYSLTTGKLCAVDIVIDEQNEYDFLKTALIRKFGEPRAGAMGYSKAYMWQGLSSSITLLAYEPSLGFANVHIEELMAFASCGV